MKLLYSITLLMLLSYSSYSQIAKSVMQNYTQKSGGQEEWDKVESFKIVGTVKLINQGGMELPYERIMTKEGNIYTALQVNGMNYIATAYDGKQVWGSNQEMKPEEKDINTSENTKLLIYDFPYPGHNWKERGYKVEYLGKATIDTIETYKIKLTKKQQWVEGEQVANVIFIYFDSTSFLPIYQETEVMSGKNKGKTMQTYLSNYTLVNGLYYPFTTTMKHDGETFQILTATMVEWNPVIEQNIFSTPNN